MGRKVNPRLYCNIVRAKKKNNNKQTNKKHWTFWPSFEVGVYSGVRVRLMDIMVLST